MAWSIMTSSLVFILPLLLLEGERSVYGTPIAYPLTQEQLAQYVAAQQTQQTVALTPQKYALPRQRQPYFQEQEPAVQAQHTYQEQIAEDPSLQEQSAPRQPLLYYRQQEQRPQVLKKYSGKQLIPNQSFLSKDQQQPEDYDPNPQYQFSFDIKDDESTNYHNRKETRDGDKISGSYSVVDSDGYIRTVTYTADPREGFKADVDRRPTDIVVKLPKHPTPGLAQQYQQVSPAAQAQALVARKQQTQQYLEASSPVDGGEPQYTIKPQQAQVYVQPQRSAAPQNAGATYFAPHRLSPAIVPVAAKAPKAYTDQNAGALLYRAYSQ
ncbi:cuticular protein 66D [Lycorma delicatula]|uniref:cuticular protein 66D n=1 Tax=Lycorma delicatula TaxID=130591 RepID=UPI003F511B76